jgi:hypothetical protein
MPGEYDGKALSMGEFSAVLSAVTPPVSRGSSAGPASRPAPQLTGVAAARARA